MYGISVFLPGLAGGFLDDVCVAAGQSVEGLRLRLRSLRYGYLEGRVLRPDGQTPAAQARVLLLNLAESVLWDWQIAEPDGRFHLDGLRPGHYRILAWKAGDTLSPPVEVVIRPDQTTEGVRLVLREGGTVRGRVIPPDNGRQGGVALPLRVAVLPAEVDVGILRQGGVSLAGLVRFAVPDAEGRFTVSDVAPGPQQVLALIEGTVRARQDVTVVAGQTAEAELRLTAADGVLTGIVTDEAGKPLENAKVWAASRLNAPNQYRTTTDRKGRFSFADLPRGTYRVFAEADGRANLTLADVSVTGEAPAAVALRLPVGDRIAGRVVGPDGQPMADAAVSTEASARTWEPPENGLTLRRTNTDETGHFELPRLAPGDYRVTIWAEGLRKQTSAPVTVQEGETPPLEVRLEAEPETP
jgi:protocatechuate 3,4-dioxygenase beta subunit